MTNEGSCGDPVPPGIDWGAGSAAAAAVLAPRPSPWAVDEADAAGWLQARRRADATRDLVLALADAVARLLAESPTTDRELRLRVEALVREVRGNANGAP